MLKYSDICQAALLRLRTKTVRALQGLCTVRWFVEVLGWRRRNISSLNFVAQQVTLK